MGRSVDYLNGAELVSYLNVEFSEDCWESEFQWENLLDYLTSEFSAKFKSLCVEENKWEGNETRIFLSNDLVNFGISSYCGLVSISIAPANYDYEQLAINWINKVSKSVIGIINNCPVGENLVKIGTLSNGKSVFSKAI